MKRAPGVPSGIVVPIPPELAHALSKYVTIGVELVKAARAFREQCETAIGEVQRDTRQIRRRKRAR